VLLDRTLLKVNIILNMKRLRLLGSAAGKPRVYGHATLTLANGGRAPAFLSSEKAV
jgi:hypothetical protein